MEKKSSCHLRLKVRVLKALALSIAWDLSAMFFGWLQRVNWRKLFAWLQNAIGLATAVVKLWAAWKSKV